MYFWRLPFQRWRIHHHGLVAVLTLVLLATVGGWYLQRSQSSLTALQAETESVQSQLNKTKAAQPPLQTNFSQTLPSVTASDEVARDISRFAQTLGVQMMSLSVERRLASGTELGKVQFNVVAQAEYRAGKAWLSELLSRYPSLSIQSLSLRVQANDALRQDVRATFVMFVKD